MRWPVRSPGCRTATLAGSCSASARGTVRRRGSTGIRMRRSPPMWTRCAPTVSRRTLSCSPRWAPGCSGWPAGEPPAGAIPYLVPPEHTRQARAILGPAPLLAPEHKAVVDPDPARARALGRARVATPYLGLVNYTSNLRRLGWAPGDLSDGGSDALIDALVAHGTADQVAAQLGRHLEAGADHVVIQLLTEPHADPVPGYRDLARALML